MKPRMSITMPQLSPTTQIQPHHRIQLLHLSPLTKLFVGLAEFPDQTSTQRWYTIKSLYLADEDTV